MAETLIVVPIITAFTIGILEFGSIFWQRQLMQAGVRDAARYWSRCRPVTAQFNATCSETIARNIAFYGNPAGTGSRRVPNWYRTADLVIDPTDLSTVSSSEAGDLVVVTGRLLYASSPLLNIAEEILGRDISPVTLRYSHSERYMGW